MREESNALGEVFQTVKKLWRYRPGQEIPAAVLDTVESLFLDGKPKPLLAHKRRMPSGWKMTFVMQPGMAFSEIYRYREYFEDATGCKVSMEKQGKSLCIIIRATELKDRYPFEWNPKPYGKMDLPIPIGWTINGLHVVDLASIPHMLVAGIPGGGKSNFLHTVATALLLTKPVKLAVVDLKRLEFAYLKNHALVVSEIDQAEKLLQALNREMDRRLKVLERAGCVKIQEYTKEMPFAILIIDELAELQHEDCQDLLNRLLRLSRAAGISVVAATQRPSSTLFAKFGDSKAMFAATMCFRARDALNSRMILDNDLAAELSEIPGRGIFQWGKSVEVQGLHLPVKQAKKLLTRLPGGGWNLERPAKRLPPR